MPDPYLGAYGYPDSQPDDHCNNLCDGDFYIHSLCNQYHDKHLDKQHDKQHGFKYKYHKFEPDFKFNKFKF
ncbi:MAG: hypothetical protein Q9226_001122 [Calogaya cf. arnoldii]